VLDIIRRGQAKRHVAETGMNRESSRSHSVFTARISITQGTVKRFSNFHIIDLAGSERSKSTNATGLRMKEANNINKSLSALGNVINTLAEKQSGKNINHIPYRDSKLTTLLRDSLGGSARTLMIANISPIFSSLSETKQTLLFAQRAKLIRNIVLKNEDSDTVEHWKTKFLTLQKSHEELKLSQQLGSRSHHNARNSMHIRNSIMPKQQMTSSDQPNMGTMTMDDLDQNI
jgi:hypothetical protein